MADRLLSVITPTYNCDRFIDISYYCLCSQIYDSWEWVVVDDGSTDSSNAILKRIAENDHRVKLHTLDSNMGRGFARNYALDHVSSDYVVIWDVDDVYLPKRLWAINLAFDQGFDFFCSRALLVDLNYNLKGARHFKSDENSIYPSFVHPTLAFKKSCVSAVGYNPNMKAGEDIELMLTLERYFKGYYAPDYFMLYLEDREVNIQKAVAMHNSHTVSINRMLNNGTINLKYKDVFLLKLKLFIKRLALNILLLAPPVYIFTVRLRYKESIESSLITLEHLSLFRKLANHEIQ